MSDEYDVALESEYLARIADLELRNGRLRKAVNWLRGAFHDAYCGPSTEAYDACSTWECQRARDILAEAKDG